MEGKRDKTRTLSGIGADWEGMEVKKRRAERHLGAVEEGGGRRVMKPGPMG